MQPRTKKALAIGGALLFLLVAFMIVTSSRDRPGVTTFRVLVPPETPPEDVVVLHVEEAVYPMRAIGSRTHEVVVDLTGGEADDGIRYGYTRGGFQVFGEQGWLGNVGPRKWNYGDGALKEDAIPAWKWLPAKRVDAPDFESAAQTRPIAPRAGFAHGPGLVDFWNGNFSLQLNATIQHAQEKDYGWVELMPPWDVVSEDPVRISNFGDWQPNWPPEDLRAEIRAFHEAGFKVALAPQVCCTRVDVANRSDEWWRGFFDQMEGFMRFHADMAREEGVESFSFGMMDGTLPGQPHAPTFAKERWDGIIDVARASGAPIGLSLHVLPPAPGPDNLWPQEAAAFLPQFDFVALAFWNPVSDKEYPTLEEIDAGMDAVWREVDESRNLTGKPFQLTQVAYFSRNGSTQPKGAETFEMWEDPAKNPFTYDGHTQALVWESLMRHVADRPWVEGVFAFGYWYVDAPLTTDSSIRGKMAETIFSQWGARIAAEAG